MKGTVSYFSQKKGYGFIRSKEGEELYFTKSGIAEGETIAAGDTVEYETIATSKGTQAFNVRKE